MSKNKKNGFTLVELLAVVIILALTFMFVAPKMASLIKEGNNTEIRLIEQKALVSARNYVNNYDTNFLNNFIEIGHEKTIYKQDLIDSGLMTIDEISQIEDFRGVKVTLLENDKLEYTISRLSDTKNYTNEELYDMIEALRAQVSSSNIFLKSYPVGSIYISTSSTNPGSTYGGTWVEYGKGKTLVGVDSSDSDFDTVEKIGGEKTHILTIDEMPSHMHKVRLSYSQNGLNNSWVEGNFAVNWSTYSDTAWATGTIRGNGGNGQFGITNNVGSSQSHNNLQPYITVYMWKRTA